MALPLALVKSGPNTLVLSGSNNYTGGTTVRLGTLVITGPNGLGNGTNLFVGSDLAAFGRPVQCNRARSRRRPHRCRNLAP